MKTSILSRIVRVAENLYRDPDSGRYYGKKKVAGKSKLHSLDTTDRPTANRELKKWLAQLDASDAGNRNLKLEALLTSFLAILKGRAPGSAKNHASIAKLIRKTFEPGMSAAVQSVRTSHLAQWLTKQAEKGEWSGSYHNTVRLFLKGWFDLAVADRVIAESENPFKEKMIKARKRGDTIRRIPTLEQFEAIIKSVREVRDNHLREESGDFLEFLGLAGVGQAEAANFKWSDDKNDHLKLRRKKTGKPFDVPMYGWLEPLMIRLRAKRNGADGEAKVFKIASAAKALRGACKNLEYHQFTQRNLRAFCIKRLYDLGCDVKFIAEGQGHSDGGILIQNTYTEVFTDRDAIAKRANIALTQKSSAKTPARRGKIIKFAKAA